MGEGRHGRSKLKLSQHAQRCFWVGIPDLSDAAHRSIDASDHSNIYISRDIRFDTECHRVCAEDPGHASLRRHIRCAVRTNAKSVESPAPDRFC